MHMYIHTVCVCVFFSIEQQFVFFSHAGCSVENNYVKYKFLSSSAHSSGVVGVSQEAESEVHSVVFRDRLSVKSLANRFERNSSRRKSSVFTSNSARKKWRDFEKKVCSWS